MGQQVLTLGLATEIAFIPLDSQIFVSSSKAKLLNQPCEDGRSIVAKRYQEATKQETYRIGCGISSGGAGTWFDTYRLMGGPIDLQPNI